MTVQEKLENALLQNGVPRTQMSQIINAAKSELEVSGHWVAWNGPEKLYPDSFYVSAYSVLLRMTVNHIKESVSRIWFLQE